MALRRGTFSLIRAFNNKGKYVAPVQAPFLVSHHQVRLVSQAMEDAKKRVALLTEDPGNDVKLKMYALFKQATVGKCDTAKPGVFDFVGQAKWSAWNELGDISKEDAEQQYISLVDSLAGPESVSSSSLSDEQAQTDGESGKIEGLEIEKANGVFSLTLNRPKKLNAITIEMYTGIINALNEAANDDSIRVFVITGAGDYYSSGNDLSNFTKIPAGGLKQLASEGREMNRGFGDAFINFPKPLVCAVNGPAVGVMTTTLALSDLVYASDNATFHTPFMTLGQSPEMCSSYTFPRIMGYARANDMLLGGRKLTAKEAFDRGLVTDVIPQNEFRKFMKDKLEYLAGLPPKSMLYSKALNRLREKETLLKVNVEESARLEERWLSEECMNAVMGFLAKQSK